HRNRKGRMGYSPATREGYETGSEIARSGQILLPFSPRYDRKANSQTMTKSAPMRLPGRNVQDQPFILPAMA
ncbi:hypothetical protein, partial [Brucella tritici]|uniref:hypothetical protein n=1 Tax=Brucella tritici TaxID=94626 RepID=UPI003D6CA778